MKKVEMVNYKIPEVVYCTTLAGIPSIAERQHRPCNTCVFNTLSASVLCTASAFQFNMENERTGARMQAHNDHKYPDFEEVYKLPCRFHITSDELKMIIDPYFME